MAFKILKEIDVFIYIPNTHIKRYRFQIYNNIQVILLNSLTLIRKLIKNYINNLQLERDL